MPDKATLTITIDLELVDYHDRDDNRPRTLAREISKLLQNQGHFETLDIVTALTTASGRKFKYSFHEGRDIEEG